ncbi:MAG: hypothetical protein A2Z19_00300 [Deltaproteobacteria bacterium RBG_16_54_18]|jgi:metal-responsive CopG/Arc/MetJ family transcriptional regulator|nr:MAG: hypothetical protein A2Z19_00300 [Deltaproteobacteria bacterium RBG_16_54_18]
MPGVKTAISLDEELLEEVDKLSHDLHVSRSKVFSMAVKDYLKRQENQSLLARLNEAYEDLPNDNEEKIARLMRRRHHEIIEQEPW